MEKATFGGGCFWCTEAMFQAIKGVQSVESGYSGGHTDKPGYREVCAGNTGHAEVVQIVFSPDEVSYSDLLRMHIASHDPTTLNKQGADTGTQYRSVIFTHNDAQADAAKAVIEEMAPLFNDPIVTEIAAFEAFYKAEDYHQNYFNQNGEQRYCQLVIDPKVRKFREMFAERLK